MTETETLPPPSPPPYTPPLRPPLRRSREVSVVGGVCGGLATHTGVDVLLFRVGFAVLTLAGGAGIVLYALLWLLVADPDGRPGPLRRWAGQRTGAGLRDTVVVVLLVLVGLVVAGAVLGNWGADGGFVVVPAAVLIAYLWYRDRDSRAVRAGHAPPAGPSADTTAATWTAPPVTATPARAPRRPRSRLGAVTISSMFLALGILATADVTTDLSIGTVAYLGTALGVVGLGLLVGTVLGRSRGLIVLGLPLLAALIAVSTLDIDLRDGIGERVWTPRTVTAIDDEYRLGGGHLLLDLSAVDFTDGDRSTRVVLNTGYAQIVVPPEVDVTVVAAVRAGDIDLFDTFVDASSTRQTSLGRDGEGGGSLTLVVDLNLGLVEVDRVG